MRTARQFGRVIHELIELFRRQKQFEFAVDRLHALHVLGAREAFLTDARIFEMHPVDGIKPHGVLDAQLAHKTHGLFEGLLLRSTLNTLACRLLRKYTARKKGH